MIPIAFTDIIPDRKVSNSPVHVFFFFYPSFFTAEYVQKVFERTAAPESKEDLVSLFVTV